MNNLDKTREYLSGRWGKGSTYNTDTGSYCAFGGLMVVHYDNFRVLPTKNVNVYYTMIGSVASTVEAETLSDVITERYPDRVSINHHKKPYFVIADFNDNKETTWEDVESVFREASDRLELTEAH